MTIVQEETLPAPARCLGAVVIVPAHNEEARIAACIEALANQAEVSPDFYEVIVVLDACTDGTEEAVQSASVRWPGLQLLTLAGPGRGAGPARAVAMDIGCSRLESAGRPRGLLATTDADSVVAADWIARQLDAISAGADAVGGNIHLDELEAALLPRHAIEERNARLVDRTRAANARGPSEHAHFSGASIGLTPVAYAQAGGMGELAALEDRDFEDRLAKAAIPVHRLNSVRVTTSARTDGRAEKGLAIDLARSARQNFEERRPADSFW